MLLAVWHFLLPILGSTFLSFRRKSYPSFKPYTVWSGSLSGYLAHGIWNLVVSVHSSERVTPFAWVHEPLVRCAETLIFNRLSLVSLHVFQWDRNGFITWIVKLQTRFFMMSKNKLSTPGPRIFCFSFLFVAFFDFNIIFQLEVSLCCQ